MRLKKCFLLEINKLVRSKTLWFSWFLGCVLSAVQAGTNMAYVKWVVEGSSYLPHPHGMDTVALVTRWIGEDSSTIYGSLFFQCIPLFAALPFGYFYVMENRSGYSKQIFARVGRKNWLLAKFIVTYLSGMIAVAVPMMFNLMLNAMICPFDRISILSMQCEAYHGMFLAGLCYSHPLLYMLAAILLASVWGGIWAVLSMSYAMITTNAVSVVVVTVIGAQFLNYLSFYLRKLLHLPGYEFSPIYAMYAGGAWWNPLWFEVCYCMIFIVILFAWCFMKGTRDEIM